MERSYVNIAEVTPTRRNWTAIVQVYDKTGTITSAKKAKFLRIYLVDSEGSTIIAMLFKKAIEHFEDRFKAGKRYEISNAKVKETDPRYVTKPNMLHWIINYSTPVELIIEDMPPTLPNLHAFQEFNTFWQRMDT